MKRDDSPPSAEEAVQHVRDHGDVIDNDPQLHKPTGTLAGFATAAALGLPAGLFVAGGSQGLTLEVLLPYTAYIPAATGVPYLYNRFKRNRNLGKATEMQETIEHELDESVDLVRYGRGRKQGLLLRWYGYDGADIDTQTYDFVDRSRRIIDFARENNIDAIAVRVNPEEAAGFQVRPGASLLMDTKQLRNSEIWDHDAANFVVVEGVDNFEQFVNQHEDDHQDPILAQMVEKLGNADIARKYGEFLRSQHHPIARELLTAAVKRVIEAESSEARSISEKQPDGSVQRKKVHTTLTVTPGGRTLHFDASTDNFTGVSELSLSGVGQLAGVVNRGTNDEFLTDILHNGIHTLDKPEILAGLYLLLERQTEAEVQRRMQLDTATATDAEIPAAFARVYSEDHSISVAESRPKRRMSIIGAKKIGAVALGFWLGFGLTHVADNAFSGDTDRYQAYAKEHHFKDSYVYAGDKSYDRYVHDPTSGHSTLDEYTWRSIYKLFDAHYKVSDTIAKILVDDLGLQGLKSSLPNFANNSFLQWQSSVQLHNAPADAYAQNGDDMIGDVPSKSNRAIFNVTALNGASAEGYWYDRYDDELVLNGGAKPFYGAGLELTRFPGSARAELPYKQADIDKLGADYMVETPYVNAGQSNVYLTGGDPLDGSVLMPVKQGTKMVAARVIDAQDKSLAVQAYVVTAEGGTYFYNAKAMDRLLAAAGIKHPVLQYWLQDVDHDVMGARAQKLIATPPQIEVRGRPKHHDHIQTKQVAQEVRHALGLPDDASDLQVYRTIKHGKTYSYTPIQRGGVTHVPLAEKSNTDALSEIGSVLAHLDSMNCNVASITMLLATLDEPKYTPITGFHDQNNDGVLSEQEAHAWLIDRETGKIVDPTPGRFAPGEDPRSDVADKEKQPAPGPKSPIGPEQGAAVLMAAACAYVAWRRRAQIAVKADAARTAATFATTAMRATVARAEHHLYGRPGSEASLDSAIQAMSSSQLAARYVANVPSGAAVPLGTTSPAELLRSALLRLNDSAIRRHTDRAKSEPDQAE